MNQIIAMLLPSVIGLKMYNKINKREEIVRKQVERYLIYVLFVNLILYLVIIFIFNQSEIVFTAMFTVKYIILSLVVAIVFSIIEKIIKDNIDIGVKVEKYEEKN